MASIWQKQAKLGDFCKIVQVLIETEFEAPKAVNSCDGNETTQKEEKSCTFNQKMWHILAPTIPPWEGTQKLRIVI